MGACFSAPVDSRNKTVQDNWGRNFDGNIIPKFQQQPLNHFCSPEKTLSPSEIPSGQEGFCASHDPENFSDVYHVSHLLGTGAEGNAWLVEDVRTRRSLALKLIKLPLPSKLVQAVMREIRLQSELGEGHLNIITAEEVVLTSHYLGLVMEYAGGGSMTQYITSKYMDCGGEGLLMPEDEARYFFKQIVSAVDYCHRHHVAHRDLKLDNTLLTADNPPLLKLCDFGFARGWNEDSHMKTVIGTPDYMSPQLTSSKMTGNVFYDGTKADVWAMGVLLCVMLIGKFPFEGESVNGSLDYDPMRKIWVQQNKSSWRENHLLASQLPFMSAEAVDLLDRMFDLEEKNRISICEIMEHPWYKKSMRPGYETTLQKLSHVQHVAEEKVAAGAFHCAERDIAISDLIKLAGSPEFKTMAKQPITPNTVFQVWTRVNLRTVEADYPVFDKTSLKACLTGKQLPKRSRREDDRSSESGSFCVSNRSDYGIPITVHVPS